MPPLPSNTKSVLTGLILDSWSLTVLRNPIFCFDPGSEAPVNKQGECSSKIALNKNVNRKVITREIPHAVNGEQKRQLFAQKTQ